MSVLDTGGRLLYYPNVRAAEDADEVAALENRHQAAIALASGRGTARPLRNLETEVGSSRAMINHSAVELQRLAKGRSSRCPSIGLPVYNLGCASVFSRYRMFPQFAEEYESALRTAPRSRDLLKRTILAHCQTGNFTLAMRLKKLFPLGTDAPDCVQ